MKIALILAHEKSIVNKQSNRNKPTMQGRNWNVIHSWTVQGFFQKMKEADRKTKDYQMHRKKEKGFDSLDATSSIV